MKFNIKLGDAKKHQIAYEFNQLLGRLVIKSSQQEIKRRIRWFNEPLKEAHVLRVETDEPLVVRIEKSAARSLGPSALSSSMNGFSGVMKGYENHVRHWRQWVWDLPVLPAKINASGLGRTKTGSPLGRASLFNPERNQVLAGLKMTAGSPTDLDVTN